MPKTKKKKKPSFEEVIRKLGYIPHDTVIDSVIINKDNLKEKEKDVDKIVDLGNKWFEEMEKKKPRKEDTKIIRKFISDKILSGHDFILVKDKKRNKAIGYVHTTTHPYYPTVLPVIEFVYVSPGYRKKGIGKKLERKGIYHLIKKEGIRHVTGFPDPTGEKLAKFRKKIVERAKKGEFDEALARWKLKGEKAVKRKKRRKLHG